MKTTEDVEGVSRAASGPALMDSASLSPGGPQVPCLGPGWTAQPGNLAAGGGGSAHCVTRWRRMTPVPEEPPKRPGLPPPRLWDSTGQRRGRPRVSWTKGAQLEPELSLTAKPTLFPSPRLGLHLALSPASWMALRTSAASLSLRGAGPHWVRVWLRSKRSRSRIWGWGHVRPRVSPSQPGCPHHEA